MESGLRIAVQKSGRLSEQTIKLLDRCGISAPSGKNKLKAPVSGFPAEMLFLRDDDIPQYVADGVADIGLLGENEVMEQHDKHVDVVERLGFSKCRLSLAIRRETLYTGISWFNNKRIATSYPNILIKLLSERDVTPASIEELGGSVEIAPSIGLADAIFDIVSTGSTLLMNGLQEVERLMESEAVLISSPNLQGEKKELLDKVLFRIRSVQRAAQYKYVLMNVPNEKIEVICESLPTISSPSVLPLHKSGWSSLHTVVEAGTFWDMMDNLKSMGAEGILELPIEKMMV